MHKSESYKISDLEDSRSALLKERSLLDEFTDETRVLQSRTANFLSDVCSKSSGYNAAFYNALTSDFDGIITSTQSMFSEAMDSISSDFRDCDLKLEEAREEEKEELSEECSENIKTA